MARCARTVTKTYDNKKGSVRIPHGQEAGVDSVRCYDANTTICCCCSITAAYSDRQHAHRLELTGKLSNYCKSHFVPVAQARDAAKLD